MSLTDEEIVPCCMKTIEVVAAIIHQEGKSLLPNGDMASIKDYGAYSGDIRSLNQ